MLLEPNSFEDPLFSSEEPHSNLFPVDASLPPVTRAAAHQPGKECSLVLENYISSECRNVIGLLKERRTFSFNA